MSARHYKNQSLLSSIGTKNRSCSETMPPKTAEAKEATEDIYREPESDSSSDELSSKAVNIVNTVFTTAPLQTKTGIKSEIRKSTRASTTRSTRATHNSQLSSGRGADTNKRKTQEDADELGSSIRDKMEFQGTARRTIKRTKKYGETPKGSISLCSKAPAMGRLNFIENRYNAKCL